MTNKLKEIEDYYAYFGEMNHNREMDCDITTEKGIPMLVETGFGQTVLCPHDLVYNDILQSYVT